jgi:hypothetical protein
LSSSKTEEFEPAESAVQNNEQVTGYRLESDDVNTVIDRDSIYVSALAYSFLVKLKESGGDEQFQRFPEGDGKNQAVSELFRSKKVIEKQGERSNALYRLCVGFDHIKPSSEKTRNSDRKSRKQTPYTFNTLPSFALLENFIAEVRETSRELDGQKTGELRERITEKKLALSQCQDEAEEMRLIVELGELNEERKAIGTHSLVEAIRNIAEKSEYREYRFEEWMIGTTQENEAAH